MQRQAPGFEDDAAFDVEVPADLAARPPSCAIVVTTWNRPRYLRRMWTSLSASRLDDAIVILVDDASDDAETRRLVRWLLLPRTPVVRLLRRVRGGAEPHGGLRAGWDLACALGAETLVNLDADMIVRPLWLARMRALHRRESAARGACIVTGFNALLHRVARTAADHHEKRSLGGANLMISRALYRELVRPCLAQRGWDWALVEAARARGVPLLATRPSVAQHIGRVGLWSSWRRGSDWAPDFRIEVPLARPVLRTLQLPRRVAALVRRGRATGRWP